MKHQRNKEHIIKEKMGKYLKYLEKHNGKWPQKVMYDSQYFTRINDDSDFIF